MFPFHKHAEYLRIAKMCVQQIGIEDWGEKEMVSSMETVASVPTLAV